MSIRKRIAEWIYPGHLMSHSVSIARMNWQEGYDAHKKEIADSLQKKYNRNVNKAAEIIANQPSEPFYADLDSNDGIYKRDDKGRIESLNSLEGGYPSSWNEGDFQGYLEGKPIPGTDNSVVKKPKRKYVKKAVKPVKKSK